MPIDTFIRTISTSTQHKYLYHFTDRANLPSISEHGLFSKEQLRSRGLWPPKAPGGNKLSWDLDIARGIDPYVSLCMTRNHRMKYVAEQDGRLADAVYLGIEPKILKTPGIKIAFGVANANDVKILPLAEALAELDVEVLYKWTEWGNPGIQTRLSAAEKFEVLVPTSVPRPLIAGIV